MAIARDQISALAVSGSTSSLAVPFSANPQAGDTVLVWVLCAYAALVVTDNGSTPSTFTLDASGPNDAGGSYGPRLYRADNITLPASGAYTVTVGLAAGESADGMTAGAIAYSGVQAGGPVAVTTNGATTATTAISSGAVSPSGSGLLYFAGYLDSNTGTESITLDWAGATEQYVETNGASYYTGAGADLLDSSGSQTATWTGSVAVTYGAFIAAYAPYAPAPVSVTASLAGTGGLEDPSGYDSAVATLGAGAALAGAGSLRGAQANSTQVPVTAALAGAGDATARPALGAGAALAGAGDVPPFPFYPLVRASAALAGAGSCRENFYTVNVNLTAGASVGDGLATGPAAGDGLTALASRL